MTKRGENLKDYYIVKVCCNVISLRTFMPLLFDQSLPADLNSH